MFKRKRRNRPAVLWAVLWIVSFFCLWRVETQKPGVLLWVCRPNVPVDLSTGAYWQWTAFLRACVLHESCQAGSQWVTWSDTINTHCQRAKVSPAIITQESHQQGKQIKREASFLIKRWCCSRGSEEPYKGKEAFGGSAASPRATALHFI